MTREDRIAEVLGAWQDARDEGRFVEPESIYAEHPDLADELRLRFAALNVIEQAYAESRMFDGDAPKRLGEFEIIRELGRGGMGVVYEAVQTSMKRTVALKVLFPSVTSSRRAIERFQREAHAAGRVQHTNIVPVYSLSREAGTWYYAMELVQGSALSSLLRQLRDLGEEPGEAHRTLLGTQPEHGGAQPDAPGGETASHPARTATQFTETHGSGRYYRDVARLFADVADALQAAHDEGVIHRDIKPANLILDEKGVLKIVDFGIARIGDQASGMTITGEVLGTPIYMSPEQARAKASEIDHRTDIYSLGASLYETLTLRTPFTGSSFPEVYRQILTTQPVAPRRHSSSIPRDLETIVTKAMEKDPSRRYASAGDLARDLRRFAEGGTIQARRIGALGHGWRRIKRHKVRSALVACTLIAVGIATYLGINAGREEERLRHIEYETLCARAHGAMARRGLLRESGTRRIGPRTGEALLLLDRAIALVPERYEAWFSRAMAAGKISGERLKDIDAARLRGLSPRAAHLARVAIFEAALRHEEAEIERAKAASLEPVTEADRYFEGVLLVRRGEFDRGIALLTAAMRGDDIAGVLGGLARYWRAFARERQGDLAGAIEDLAKLPAQADYATKIHIASLWRRLGQHERAQAIFEDALAHAHRVGSPEAIIDLWFASHESKVEPWITAVAREAVKVRDQTPWILLVQADAASRANDEKRALLLAEHALEKNDELRTAHLLRGRALTNLGLHEEAAESLERAVSLATGVPGVLAQAASMFINMGRLERALELLDQAILLAPYECGSHADRSVTLARLRRFEDAEQALEVALRLDSSGYAFLSGGQVWHARGDYELQIRGDKAAHKVAFERAIASFESAAKLHPGWGRPWSGLAAALNNLKRYEEAIKAADRATSLGNDSNAGQFTKAYALFGLKRYAEALAILDQLRAQGAVRSIWLDLRARILFQQATSGVRAFGVPLRADERAKLEAALKSLNEAFRLGVPNRAHSLALRGRLHYQLGMQQDGIADYRKSVALQPGNHHLQLELAQGLVYGGGAKEALAILDMLRRALPNRAHAWYLTAICRRNLGQTKAALEAVLEALRLNPTDVSTILNAAVLHDDLGDLAGSLSVLNEGLRRLPDDAVLQANQGVCLNELGRFADALSAFDRAIELGLDNPGLRAMRSTAQLYAENGPEIQHLIQAYQLYEKKLYARSALEFEAALEEPRLRSDTASGHLYNAVCSAALASSRADGDEMLRLRRQAMAWLTEDRTLRDAAVEVLRKQVPPPADLMQSEALYRQRLEHTKVNDLDLASLRGLPEFKALFEDSEKPAKEAAAGR